MTPEQEKIVLDNYGLVEHFAFKLASGYFTPDNIQNLRDDGIVGLINGAKTYDESKGFKISTYLSNCIKNEMLKGIYLRTMMVRKLNYMSLPSIDKDIGENTTIKEFISSSYDLEKEIEEKDFMERVRSILNTQNPNWYKCIYMRFFLGMKIEDIGKELGLTKGNVASILLKSKRLLKERLYEARIRN